MCYCYFIEQVSGGKISDITVHALLLWASMGLFMPLGILIIRVSITQQQPSSSSTTSLLFYLHVAFQVPSIFNTCDNFVNIFH